MTTWTTEEVDSLRRAYPTAPWGDLLRALAPKGRRAIYKKAFQLGIDRRVHEVSPEARARSSARARTGDIRRGRFAHPIVVVRGIDGKVCSACGWWLPLERFARHAECAGGRRTMCTTCTATRSITPGRSTAASATTITSNTTRSPPGTGAAIMRTSRRNRQALRTHPSRNKNAERRPVVLRRFCKNQRGSLEKSSGRN